MTLLFLSLEDLLDFASELVLKSFLGQLAKHEVNNGQEVLVHLAKEVAHRVQLRVVGSKDLRRARKVVQDRD